jgi:hypothetical protein
MSLLFTIVMVPLRIVALRVRGRGREREKEEYERVFVCVILKMGIIRDFSLFYQGISTL